MTPLYDCGDRFRTDSESGQYCGLSRVDINRAGTAEYGYAIAQAGPRLEAAFRVAYHTAVIEIRRHALHKEEFFQLFKRRVPGHKRRSHGQVVLVKHR